MASENDRWADDAAVHDLARIITDTVGGVLSMAGAFATAQAILNRYQWLESGSPRHAFPWLRVQDRQNVIHALIP